jgi:hypothetical protein
LPLFVRRRNVHHLLQRAKNFEFCGLHSGQPIPNRGRRSSHSERVARVAGETEILGVGSSVDACHGRDRLSQAPKSVEFAQNPQFDPAATEFINVRPRVTASGRNCSRFPACFVHGGRITLSGNPVKKPSTY